MRAVEASSRNEAVIQQAQNEVRSAQASIKFLEDELAKLQMGGDTASPRRDGHAKGPSIGSGAGYPQHLISPSKNGNAAPSPRKEDRPLPPPPPGATPEAEAKPKNYTQLGESPGPALFPFDTR